MPSISVVCPTYNSSTYIEKNIFTLLQQTFASFEVLYSDDGSKDATLSLLESYRAAFEKRGITLVILKNSHQGPGETRNSGIKRATGEWIAFLDSDDLWKENKLSVVSKAIEKNRDANFITHWEEHMTEKGEKKILKHGTGYSHNAPLAQQIYKTNLISTSAVTCKKKILEKMGGFDPILPSGQDYELWLRLSPHMALHAIPEVLGSYILRQGNITSRPYGKRYLPFLSILFRHRKKGGAGFFMYRVLRATLTRQWIGR